MSSFVLTAQLQLQAPNNVAQVVRQIQSQLNNINVNLNVQNAVQTQRQLQQITTQTHAASSAADRMGRAFALSVRRFAAFSVATRAVTLFTATLSKAIQTSIDFEREIVKISQVTGESVSRLRSLTNTITDLSTSLGVSSSSLIGVGRILSQAGFKADDLTTALRTLAKTELAPTFEDINQTAEGAVAIFNQFRLGAGALEEQLGAVNAVAGQFAVEAGDLIGAVRRVGGVFKASGGNLNELLALFTSVRATTRESAESIATGLRTIFTRIQRPKTIEFLKQFGVELVDLEGRFVGPFEAVKRLSGALAGLGEGDLTFIRIAEELGGFRQIGKVLPLLQQFSVAQDALNTANKAGNSLTKDAATAQQALSVRITKVKEEFLALIRSITETKTFQIMANTALSLASALVQIGEAIKPLLPLLAAVAAVNFAKGIGTFAGGLMRGMQSGRTYNKGGKVHHFARGGMVPGTGNSDTVPAMLQPGEFVIRKSSVNQLGASNLAAMNENKLNKGGVATLSAKNALIGKQRLTPQEMMRASKRAGYDIERLDNGRISLSRNGKVYHNNLTDDEASSLLASMATGYNRGGKTTAEILSAARADKTLGPNPNKQKTKTYAADKINFSVADGSIGAFFMNRENSSDDLKPFKKKEFDLTNAKILSLPGIESKEVRPKNKKGEVLPRLETDKRTFKAKGVLQAGKIQSFFPSLNDVSKGSLGSIVESNVKQKLSEAVISTANFISQNKLLDIPPIDANDESMKQKAAQRIQADTGAIKTTSGYLFEGVIDAITGARPASANAVFDFPASALVGNRNRLGSLFGSESKINLLKQADAKASYSSSIIDGDKGGSISSKIVNSINSGVLAGINIKSQKKNLGGTIERFATGGSVGTDTVPALLTPGEFVVNRSSAQSIGYSNLNRMNKVGKYAKGGVVQGFNTGGVAKVKSIKFSNFRDIEKFLRSMWVDGIQKKRLSGERITPSDSWTFKHPLIGSVSLTGRETEELYSYFESQKKSLIRNKGFRTDPTEAILSYKDNSADLNMGLTDKKLSNEQKKEVSTLKKIATDKLPQTLYSGIGASRTSIIQSQVGKNLLQSVGKRFGLPGFLSTSSDIKVAKTFGNGLLLRIATNPSRKGVAADKHVSNEYQHEKEFILPPNSKFRVNKFKRNILDIAQLNKGGGVGTDTVPALLTPGEFVVNKKSAQAIGYGSLNRMNKVGKYANGGIVQRFAKGTSGAGVKGSGAKGGGDIPFQLIALPGMGKLDATFFALDKVLFGAIGKIGLSLEGLASGLIGAQSSTQLYKGHMLTINSVLGSVGVDFGKILAENNAVNKRTKAQQMELVDVIATNIKGLIDSGASQKQVRDAALRFAQHLDQNTARLRTGTPPLAGTAAAAATVAAAPQPPRSGFASVSGTLGQSAGGGATANNTAAINANTTSQNSAAKSAMEVVAGNKLFAVSMASSLIQGFLPAADENSSALLRLTHSVLGLVTAAASFGFGLQALGISLSKTGIAAMIDSTVSSFQNLNFKAIAGSITSFFSQTAATATNTVSTVAQTAAINSNTASQVSAGTKLAGGLQAAAIATAVVVSGFYLLFSSIKESARIEKERAIKSGDVEAAGKAGEAEGAAGTRLMFSTVGAAIGGTIGGIAGLIAGAIPGSIVPGAGTAAGGAAGAAAGATGGALAGGGLGLLIADMAGFTEEAAFAGKLLAETSARFSNMNKALEKSSATAAVSLDQLNRGAITARDALDSVSAGTQAAVGLVESAKATEEAAVAAAKRRWFGRDAAVARARSEGAERTGEARKKSEEQLRIIQPMLSRQMRTTAFEGGDFDDFISSLSDAEVELLNLVDGGINNAYKQFVNVSKEIEIARKQFEALNLGLRSVSASADAAAVRMTNSMNSFDLATVPGVSALNTLQASLTAAGQNISQVEFDSALGQVSGILKQFGADAKQVTAFEDLTKGVAAAQRDFPSIFDGLKAKIEADEFRGMNPEAIGEEFKKLVAQSLDRADIGDAAKEKIIAAMGDVKIDEKDMKAILGGDMSILEKYFGDAAEEVGKQMKEFGEKWITANQELIKATQERIEAERNLVAAQREAVDLYMEGREVQGKYGGPAVSMEEKRGAILAKANAGAQGAGLTQMRTGSLAELRQRNMQTLGGFARVEGMKGKGAKSELGAQGAEMQATQQNLKQAQKDQIQTIRDLIKLEEEELKIIQEKNKLEKNALESLLSGDIEQFFDQQAAMGAQAAIATGDKDAANLFGTKAVGDAFKDIQRQQEAGVQSLFGRQLGGSGGLAEQAAGAALSSRGVTDPRMAQRLAGTTAEEEASKSRLRDLGGALGEAGAVGAAMAEMQVQTAQMKVEQATLNIANLETGGVALARGGVVYADRGMFVPRGTDTVPAMLTPGEFVVRREAVNRGNNLQLLHSINEGGNAGGFARGGKIGYYNNGGRVQYRQQGGDIKNAGQLIDPQLLTNLSTAFNSFISGFNQSIQNLKDTKLQINLDSVNVNVNFTGTSVLTQISDETRRKVIDEVVQKMKSEYGVGAGGKIEENKGLLAKPGQGS